MSSSGADNGTGGAVRRGVMVVATALVAVAAGTLPGASASGDATVVVRGSTLPSGAKSQLTMVGCDSVFGRTPEAVAPMIGAVPGRPGNKRSLGFDPAGGNAIGSVSYVDQVAATTVVGMSVHALAGSTGVAYVGYQAPKDVGTSLMWIGRSALSVAADVWTPINVTGQGFTWTQYDMETQQPIGGEVGSSGIPAFVQAMGGEGAGFYMVGFGCDGNAFNTDDWRIGTAAGATTYDFEGYDVAVGQGQDAVIAPGESATLTTHVSSPNGAPLAGVQVVLESKGPDGEWTKVRQARGPEVTLTEHPAETTTYRWKVYSTSMVEGDESRPFTVRVADPADPPSDVPSDPPSTAPSDPPSTPPSTQSATEPASQAPAAEVQAPAEEPTPAAKEPAPTSEPAAEATPPADEQASEKAGEPAAPPADASEGTAG